MRFREKRQVRQAAKHLGGDALMLWSTDGHLAWRYIVPYGENLSEDIAEAFAGTTNTGCVRAPIGRVELLREAPLPPQAVMAAQLAAIRQWNNSAGRSDEVRAILNWQEVP